LNERSQQQETVSAKDQGSRRPYEKPAFQYEQVFETMALACGKISPTQGQCRFNRKHS
jgi:hypothetical protein